MSNHDGPTISGIGGRPWLMDRVILVFLRSYWRLSWGYMRQWLVDSGPQRVSLTLSKAPLGWSRAALSRPPCSRSTLMSSRLFLVTPSFQVMVVIYTRYWSPSFSLLMMWFFLLLSLRVFKGFWIDLHLFVTWDSWLWILRRLVLWSSMVWRPHISIFTSRVKKLRLHHLTHTLGLSFLDLVSAWDQPFTLILVKGWVPLACWRDNA